MNDLLAELNATVSDEGSASKKPDRPSSPLRPNPKYCTMEQPAGFRPAAANCPHLQKRGTPSHSAPHRGPGGTPTEFAARGTIIRAPPNAPMLQKLAELTGTPYSAPILPPIPSVSPAPSAPRIVQKEASTGGGMEVDGEAPILHKSSSPIKPNEKYCKIVTPSKRPMAPRPLEVQLARPVQQSHNQGLVWRPDGDRPHSTRRTSDPPPPDPPQPDRGLPEPMDRSPSPVDYRTPAEYRTPPGLAALLPVAALYSRSTDAHYAGPGYGGRREGERRHSAGSDDLATTPSSSRAREKAIADWDRQIEVEEIARRITERMQSEELERRMEREREKARMEIARQRERDEHDRKKREEKERREFQARVEARRRVAQQNQRIEEQRAARLKAEEDDRRRYKAKQEQRRKEEEEEERRQGRYSDDVRKEVERKKQREEAERRARAQLHSFVGAQSRPEAATVRMTTEQLEALKAECIAEGERKAMEEARKAAASRDESEPMEVEESDLIESSVPASCAGTTIAPKKLWMKAEPRSYPGAVRPRRVKQEAVDEVAKIPLPPTSPPGSAKVKEEEEGKKKDGKGKEDDENDLEIVEKQPAEVITLSDGEEDTVATVPGNTVAGSTVAVKQEARSREVDDDVWIFASKRVPKKKHVFDPTKVKREKEDEKSKASDASQTPPILPFITSRVKVEPAEKAGSSGGSKKDTVPPSSKAVRAEPAEKAGSSGGSKRDTVKTPPTAKSVKAESGGGKEERMYTVALPPRLLARKAVKDESSDEEWVERVDVQPRTPSAAPPPDCENGAAAAADVLQAEVGAALARLKTLIPEIGQTVQSARKQQQQLQLLQQVQPQPQLHPQQRKLRLQKKTQRQGALQQERKLQRLARHSDGPYVPAPGSFMHALRTGCRKRRRCCNADEREWQRYSGEFKRRILEDEDGHASSAKHVSGGPSYPREAPPFFLTFPLHSLPGLNED